MEPMLRAMNLTKRFGGLTAVNKTTLEVYPGEVVGLLGDNGAGKSTFIKMVSGVYKPDEGEIWFDGNKLALNNPREARDSGIETIYQDLALADNLDVGSNVFLGREVKKPFIGPWVQTLNRKHMQDEALKVLDRLDIEIPTMSTPIRS